MFNNFLFIGEAQGYKTVKATPSKLCLGASWSIKLWFDTTFFYGGVIVVNIFNEPPTSIQPTPILPLERECTLPLPLLAPEVSNRFDSSDVAIASIVTIAWSDGNFYSQKVLGWIELGLP
jgi:hypothetical protein